jgi:hypothetical protein
MRTGIEAVKQACRAIDHCFHRLAIEMPEAKQKAFFWGFHKEWLVAWTDFLSWAEDVEARLKKLEDKGHADL